MHDNMATEQTASTAHISFLRQQVRMYMRCNITPCPLPKECASVEHAAEQLRVGDIVASYPCLHLLVAMSLLLSL